MIQQVCSPHELIIICTVLLQAHIEYQVFSVLCDTHIEVLSILEVTIVHQQNLGARIVLEGEEEEEEEEEGGGRRERNDISPVYMQPLTRVRIRIKVNRVRVNTLIWIPI